MSIHENIRLPAERKQLVIIRSFVEQHAGRTPASVEEVQDLIQAVDEAATNIVVHGYQDSSGEVEVVLDYEPGRITVTLRDQAPPFDPTTVSEPDLQLPLDQRPIGGLGVHLIRCCINEFFHSARPGGGNELRLIKYLKANGGLE